MNSMSSTLSRMSASDIVIKGELPVSPSRGAAHGRLVSQDQSTVRGGDGGTVGRTAVRPNNSRWQDDPDDDKDVFEDDPRVQGRGEEGAELGEELDDRTMLDSVILPIIASVSFLHLGSFSISWHVWTKHLELNGTS